MPSQQEYDVANIIWNNLLGKITPTPDICGNRLDFEYDGHRIVIEVKSYPKYADMDTL